MKTGISIKMKGKVTLHKEAKDLCDFIREHVEDHYIEDEVVFSSCLTLMGLFGKRLTLKRGDMENHFQTMMEHFDRLNLSKE